MTVVGKTLVATAAARDQRARGGWYADEGSTVTPPICHATDTVVDAAP
jgi:hypothetical protein